MQKTELQGAVGHRLALFLLLEAASGKNSDLYSRYWSYVTLKATAFTFKSKFLQLDVMETGAL